MTLFLPPTLASPAHTTANFLAWRPVCLDHVASDPQTPPQPAPSLLHARQTSLYRNPRVPGARTSLHPPTLIIRPPRALRRRSHSCPLCAPAHPAAHADSLQRLVPPTAPPTPAARLLPALLPASSLLGTLRNPPPLLRLAASPSCALSFTRAPSRLALGGPRSHFDLSCARSQSSTTTTHVTCFHHHALYAAHTALVAPLSFANPRHCSTRNYRHSRQTVKQEAVTFLTLCETASVQSPRPAHYPALHQCRAISSPHRLVVNARLGSSKEICVRGGQEQPLRTYQRQHLLASLSQRSHRGP